MKDIEWKAKAKAWDRLAEGILSLDVDKPKKDQITEALLDKVTELQDMRTLLTTAFAARDAALERTRVLAEECREWRAWKKWYEEECGDWYLTESPRYSELCQRISDTDAANAIADAVDKEGR